MKILDCKTNTLTNIMYVIKKKKAQIWIEQEETSMERKRKK